MVFMISTSSAIIQEVECMRATGLTTMGYYCLFSGCQEARLRWPALFIDFRLSAISDSCYDILFQLYPDNKSWHPKAEHWRAQEMFERHAESEGKAQSISLLTLSMNVRISLEGRPPVRKFWI